MSPPNTSSMTGNPMGYDISVLIDSNAVVEKKGFVATGTLTYVAGELLEIEFPQYDHFSLGEQVKIMIYAKGGIYVFESTVLAKDPGALVVLNPPENRRKFQDKRQDPRVPVEETARVLSLFEYARNLERKFPDPPSIRLDNISLSGLGLLFDIDLPLQPRNRLHLALDLGFPFECRTEIVHLQPHENGIRCGTRIVELIDPNAKNWLRSYILKCQIEAYYKEKAERIRKAMLGDEEPAGQSVPSDPTDLSGSFATPSNPDRPSGTYLFNSTGIGS